MCSSIVSQPPWRLTFHSTFFFSSDRAQTDLNTSQIVSAGYFESDYQLWCSYTEKGCGNANTAYVFLTIIFLNYLEV